MCPAPGLSREAHVLLGVFAWTVAYWVTEALPVAVTALPSSVLAIVLGIAPAQKVFVAYADPVVFLFVGSFILTEAMAFTAAAIVIGVLLSETSRTRPRPASSFPL